MIFGTFISWSASNTSDLTSTIGNVLGDLTIPIVIIMGIGIGLIIFEVIVGVIRGRSTH